MSELARVARRTFTSAPKLSDLVSRLRNETSLSMSMCRQAAVESKHDYTLAMELLSKMSKISFKPKSAEDQAAGKEGIFSLFGDASKSYLIEVSYICRVTPVFTRLDALRY